MYVSGFFAHGYYPKKDKSVTNIFNWVWLGIPNHTKIMETFHGKGSSKG